MVLLGITSLFILILLAVLFLPMGVELAWSENDPRWRLILAGLRFHVPDSLLQRLRDRTPKSKPPKPPTSVQASFRRVLDLFSREPGNLHWEDVRETWRMIKRVYRHIRFRVHQFDIVIAAPDPALAGMVYGWSWAAASWLPASWPLTLQADFTQTRPRANIRAEMTLIPGIVLWNGLRYFIRRAQRRLLRRAS
jgi:hypothetical protein